MGALLDKIIELATRWKRRIDKVDVILDTTIANMQEMAKAIELMKSNMEESRKLIDSLNKSVSDAQAKVKALEEKINKAKQSFWGRLVFGN